MSFNVGCVRIIVSMEYGKNRNYFYMIMNRKQYKVKKDYAEKFSETTGIEIKSQNWGGNR